MFKKIFIIGCLFISSVAGETLAYRPLGTEDATVAGKGVAQTEVSLDYLKWKNGDVEQTLLLVPIYGLTDALELSIEIPYLFHAPVVGASEGGTGDINIVAKCLLVQEKDPMPAFTVKGVVKMDNGDYERGLGSGDRDYSLVAAASKNSGRAAVHGMFGHTWVRNKKDDNLQNIILYGIAIDYAATEPFHVLAEVNGNRHPDRNVTDHPLTALIGGTYKVSDKLILDAACRKGLNDAVPDWSTTLGASVTF